MEIIKLSKVERFTGFAAGHALPGEKVMVLQKASLTSDDKMFYTYMDGISAFISKYAILNLNAVSQLLLVLHKDCTASLYINDFFTSLEINAKRSIAKGEIIRSNDIADIRRLSFEGIPTLESDNIVYCFKVGWKFGLYFNLRYMPDGSKLLDIKQMQLELGTLYRYLAFEDVYKTIESRQEFDDVLKNGWFPFIEIIGSDFKELRRIYQDKVNAELRLTSFVNGFGKDRINKMRDKWWAKKLFLEKKPIIEAGVNAYLKNDSDSNILCLKTLLPEIEGLMRMQYFFDKNIDAKKSEVFIRHIGDKVEARSQSPVSLFCPREFVRYLQEVVFPFFDLAKGQLDLSRHTASHGLAKPEQYTKMHALQAILTLDQIYFYL